jgi:hypothetical protein
MFPVGWIFGVMGWPTFHSWGLVHGSFVVAWPMLSLLSWAVVNAILARLSDAKTSDSEEDRV